MNILTLIKTLRVVAELESCGCHVLRSRIMPLPAVHISPPPDGAVATYAFRELPQGTWCGPVECCATMNGVKVTWWM